MRHCSRSGVVSCILVAFALLASLLAFAPAAHAQGGVSQIVLEDPTSEPAAPTCQSPATYAIASSMPNVWTVSEIVPGESSSLIGTFISTDSQVIVEEIAIELDGMSGSCVWSLATGMLAFDGAAPVEAGLLIAEVYVSGPEGVQSFAIGTLMPLAATQSAMESIRSAAGVIVDPGVPDHPGETSLRLGSFCNCMPCSNGRRFRHAFTVLVASSQHAMRCCELTCRIACGRWTSGATEAEAWAIGQSFWLHCMWCS